MLKENPEKLADSLIRLAKIDKNTDCSYLFGIIRDNYSFPKRQIAKNLLGTVNKSPGHIDYMFKAMAYISFAGVLTYSAVKHALKR